MENTIKNILTLVGGVGNISELDNCLTRVRIIIKDEGRIVQKAVKDLEKEKCAVVVHGKNIHIIVGVKAGDYKKRIAEELKNPSSSLAADILAAAGGSNNIEELDNCLTRVRLTLKDAKLVQQAALKSLENQGFPSVLNGKSLHIIAGKEASFYAKSVREHL